MTPITVRANEISQPVYVGAGSRITLTGSGYVEWCAARTLQDAMNDSFAWSQWPGGSAAGYQDTVRGMAIRVVGTGDCSVTVEPGVSDPFPSGQYWDAQTVTAQTDPVTGRIKLQAGAKDDLLAQHPRYHFHGFAGLQLPDSTVFRDISGMGNDAVRGANLSVAQLWANAGYASTVDPIGGATDSVLRIPSLNFDYSGGEKLIVWWHGSATPEGADATLFGDAVSSSTPGVRCRMKTTGKFDVVLYGAGAVSRFGGASTGVPFDGTSHSLAFCFDGATKKYGMWVDETYEAAFGSALSSFASGADADTRNAVTWNIGAGSAAPGGTEGSAVKTRALVILRLAATDTMPSVAALTSLFKQLRANPTRVVGAGAF